MIPIHDFVSKDVQSFRVVKLDALTEYDTTQPHRHNYFEFFIFDQGDGTHDIDFKTFPIRSKSIHIVAPGQVHQVKRALNTNGFVILFDFSAITNQPKVTDFLYDHMCYDISEISPVYEFSGKDAEQMIQTVEMIWRDYNSENDLKSEFLKNHLNLICISCIRTLQQNNDDLSMSSNDPYIAFRRLLRSNFKTIKKVKDYASALHITEKKLNDIVRKKTGNPCSKLIYDQIILEAKRLLQGNISSKEVAYTLNFDDPAHFSKFFKSQTGISPSEFLKVQA